MSADNEVRGIRVTSLLPGSEIADNFFYSLFVLFLLLSSLAFVKSG